MTNNTNDEQGVDFDRDLARLNQIRAALKSARPKPDNPAWLNTHGDLAFALGFIDSLWNAYTSQGRKLDAALAALVVTQEKSHGA